MAVQRFSGTIWSQCLRAMKVARRPAGHRVQLVADFLTEVHLGGVKTSPPLQVRSEVSAEECRTQEPPQLELLVYLKLPSKTLSSLPAEPAPQPDTEPLALLTVLPVFTIC